MATDRLFNHSQGERLISAVEELADYTGNAVGTRGERNGWSAILNLNYSNPMSIVTYADRAEGMLRGWEYWKNTDLCKGIRPCILRDGVVQYYLDPDDYSKKDDGTSADITTIGDDVMVEFPFMGYKIKWIDETKKLLKVSVTLEPHCDDFCYAAFSYSYNSDCDRIYIGAYDGYADSNKIYSVSGVTPTVYNNYSNIQTYTNNRGDRYTEYTFTIHTLIQCLYILVTGNLNSQSVIGIGKNGNVDITTGEANTHGFCNDYSPDKTSPSYAIKWLGLENLWGNTSTSSKSLISTYIKGCDCNNADSGSYIRVKPFANNNISGSETHVFSKPFPITGSLFIAAPTGISLCGFIPAPDNGGITSGTSTGTYFCDSASLIGFLSNAPTSQGSAGYNGIFALGAFASNTNSLKYGGRIVYMRERII